MVQMRFTFVLFQIGISYKYTSIKNKPSLNDKHGWSKLERETNELNSNGSTKGIKRSAMANDRNSLVSGSLGDTLMGVFLADSNFP